MALPIIPLLASLASSFIGTRTKNTALAAFNGALGGSVSALARLPSTCKRFGESMEALGEPLARFNGTIAASSALLRYQNIQNQIKTAQETAGSQAALTDAQRRAGIESQQLDSSLRTMGNLIGMGLTGLGGFFTRIGNDIIESSGLGKALRDYEQWLRDIRGAQATPFAALLEELQKQANDPRKIKPLGGKNP